MCLLQAFKKEIIKKQLLTQQYVNIPSQVVTEVTAGTTDQTVDVAIPALTVNVSGATGTPQ